MVIAPLLFGVITMANSDGVPGDPLYAAKRVAEHPVGLVAHDLVASNRLAELKELIARDAEPTVLLAARLDAANAVADRPVDDELSQAFSLLAWPGGLSAQGADGVTSNQGLLVLASEWELAGEYRSTLLDGNLVTISDADDQLDLTVTGEWQRTKTDNGWQLLSPELGLAYIVERVDEGLWVRSVGPTASEGSEPDKERAALETSRGSGPITTANSNPGAKSEEESEEGAGDRPSTSNLNRERDEPDNNSSSTTAKPTDEDPSAATKTLPTTTPPTTGTAGTAGTTSAPTTSTTIRPPVDAPRLPPTPTTTKPATPTTEPAVTTTKPATTTTEPTTTTTTVPAVPDSWTIYLRNPGSGNTSSSRTLLMAPGSSPGGSLGNYDTNRDGDPGLMIQKDGAGLSGSDSTKVQEWRWTTSSASSVSGPSGLTIWLAAKDFKTDEQIGVVAGLDLCTTSCVRIGSGQWSGQGGNGFQRATLNFGSINRDIPAGAELRLKIAVPDNLATTDVWFAYDAGLYPSRINLG